MPVVHTIEPEELTVVWGAKAVAQWDTSRSFDPTHTITSYPVAIKSPWFRDDMQRKFGTAWVITDADGALVARS